MILTENYYVEIPIHFYVILILSDAIFDKLCFLLIVVNRYQRNQIKNDIEVNLQMFHMTTD